MTYYLPHVEALRAAYEAGALVDAVITRNPDGHTTVTWPSGRTLCAVAPEVIEEMVSRHNMLYRVTRALANMNRAGHRADIDALVRESWELLGRRPDLESKRPA